MKMKKVPATGIIKYVGVGGTPLEVACYWDTVIMGKSLSITRE